MGAEAGMPSHWTNAWRSAGRSPGFTSIASTSTPCVLTDSDACARLRLPCAQEAQVGAIKYSTTGCPSLAARWNDVPTSVGSVKSGAEEVPPDEALVVVAVALLEGVLRLAARTKAMIPTRSASVTASTAMRGSSLRRGERRRALRAAVCGRFCAGVPAPIVLGRLRDGDEWAMNVSFPLSLIGRHLTCAAQPGGPSLSGEQCRARTFTFPRSGVSAWSAERAFARV